MESASTPPTSMGTVEGPGQPPEPWERAACRRLRRSAWFWGLLAVALLVTLVGVRVLCSMDRFSSAEPWNRTSPAWLVCVAIAAMLIITVWRLTLVYVSRWRIVPRVLATGGRLCPRCCGEPADSGDELYCPWCDASFAPEPVRRWWQAWAVDGERARVGLRPEPVRRFSPMCCGAHGYVHRHWPLARYLGLLVAYAVFVAILPGDDLLVAAARFWPALGFAILVMGSLDVWAATQRRRGSAWHCAACGYQRSPEGPHGPRCPECGSLWGPPGTLVRGRPFRRRTVAAVVILGMWVSALPVLRSAIPLRWQLIRFAPTSVLVGDVVLSGTTHPRIWAELQRRTLSDAQVRRLAEPLIAQIERRRRLAGAPGRWLGQQFARRRLPADLLDRMLAPMFSAWIETCDAPRVGQPCEARIGIRTDTFGVQVPDFGPLVPHYVRQLCVRDEVQYRIRFGFLVGFSVFDEFSSIQTFPWMPRGIGPTTLSADIYIFVSSERQWQNIQMRPDGTLEFDKPPLYSRRIVLTCEVAVHDPNATSPP